jgi:ABC-type transport system involved in multi-copper enzyme maturation permease subunit
MLEALFLKEWRQLRVLRWAGIVLGAVLPALVVAGAEAGRRGWLPFGRGGEWSNQEVLGSLSPAMVCLFVWPLMALLLAAQAFTADASTGTESFLLERPVSRGRVWLARLLATVASALTLALVTGGTALVTAVLAAGQASLNPITLGGFAAAGIVAMILAALAALPSASLIRSPVGTVLAGLLFAAAPALAAAFLGAAFPFATLGGSVLPIGLFVPWLVVIGYALASHAAETRGEPAGRGRRFRAARVLAAAAAAVSILFFAGAALAVRSAPQGFEVVASPRDDVAIALGNWGSGRLLDTRTGEAVRRLPPPAYAAAWNEDGSVLAVATAGSPFGAMDAQWRVEFLGADGKSVAPAARGPGDTYPVEMRWSGGRLVILASGFEKRGAAVLLWGRPGDAAFLPLSYRTDGQDLRLVSGDARGVLLKRMDPSGSGDGTITKIVRLDWNGSAVSTSWERDLPHRSFLSPWSSPLSPSGRYLTLHVFEPLDNPTPGEGGPDRVNRVRPVVLDLDTGASREIEGRSGLAAWIEGDGIVWVARDADVSAVFTAAPGNEPRFERAWAGARVAISSSPGFHRVLVTVLPRTEEDPIPPFAADSFGPSLLPEGGAEAVTGPQLWLFEPAESRWTRLQDQPWSPGEFFVAGWAGPRTIYRHAKGRLVFESIAAGP